MVTPCLSLVDISAHKTEARLQPGSNFVAPVLVAGLQTGRIPNDRSWTSAGSRVRPVAEVVLSPQHPYTKALLSVVPKRDPRDRSDLQILTGEPPNPVSPPSGCRFHPRCPVAEDRCRTEDPALRAVHTSAAHRAACVLIGEGTPAASG
jgi:oligopeptide/dipeptide ABC transporter ATP-binding protein